MSRRPYHERQFPNMFLTYFCGDRRLSQLQDPHGLGLSALTGLVANDLSRVTFLLLFMVEVECDVELVEGGGGGGGEQGGVTIFLLRKKN